MILATKISSEKGKEIVKTANEFITMTLTNDRVSAEFSMDYITLGLQGLKLIGSFIPGPPILQSTAAIMSIICYGIQSIMYLLPQQYDIYDSGTIMALDVSIDIEDILGCDIISFGE